MQDIFRVVSDYENLSFSGKKKLLEEISDDVKKYRNLHVFVSPDTINPLIDNIMNNCSVIKSDTEIILDGTQIVNDNLDIVDNLKDLNKQRILLNLMYSIVNYPLLLMNEHNTTTIPYDATDVLSLFIDYCGIEVNENCLIHLNSINNNFNDKHNEILTLSNKIKTRNL